MSQHKVSATLREAIDASEMPRGQICQRIGVTKGLLSLFVAGRRGLSLPVVDRLAEVLGLELVEGDGVPRRTVQGPRSAQNSLGMRGRKA